MSDYPVLSKIDSPADLKQLNIRTLQKLSVEISNYIQEVVKNVGGHYSSLVGDSDDIFCLLLKLERCPAVVLQMNYIYIYLDLIVNYQIMDGYSRVIIVKKLCQIMYFM